MATFKVLDGASEYRIEIVGKFAGPCVRDVSHTWEAALQKNSQRRITVDITRISGYDNAGKTALREMHKHGTLIAAGNPHALSFLDEITATRRGSAVLHEAPKPEAPSAPSPTRTNIAAAGE